MKKINLGEIELMIIQLINVKKGYKTEDKLIRNKLKEEYPGILNWAIE